MKKLSILLVGLVLIAGLASAQVTLSMSGSSTLNWGIQGSLIDNSDTFGNVNADFATFATRDTAHRFMPHEIVMKMEAAEDDLVIVRAEAKFTIGPVTTAANAYAPAFEFIEFPNVVPGVLAVRLNKSAGVSTPVTSKASATAAPNVLVTATPAEGLTTKIGLVFKQGGLTRAGTDAPTETFVYDTYIAFGTSILAEYALALNDDDSVKVAVGAVVDTAWTNSVYGGPVTGNIASQQLWGPKAVVASTAVLDPEKNETYGFATIPVGLTLDATIAGLTAGLKFQTRMVQGADIADVDADGVVRPAYALPMYVGVNLGYEMEMAGMTIKPSANFKYSSDFWKWVVDTDADDNATGIKYDGNVSAAEFAGRPMSAGVGLAVEGIADGLLDVSLSGSAGFGDGLFAHGFSPIAFEWTKLLQDTIDAIGTPTTGINDGFFAAASPLAVKASLGLTARPIENVTVKNTTSYTLDNLGILGLMIDKDEDPDELVLWGSYLTRLDNNTRAEYALQVGGATAATFFGELNFRRDGFVGQDGFKLNTTTGVVDATEQAFKSTLGYKIGVQVRVSMP